MLDFGAGELVVIGVVALVAIGPKELPGVLRTVGQVVGRMRRMASDFQSQFNDALRDAELAEARKAIEDIQTQAAAPSSVSGTAQFELSGGELNGISGSIASTPVFSEPGPALVEPHDVDGLTRPSVSNSVEPVSVADSAENSSTVVGFAQSGWPDVGDHAAAAARKEDLPLKVETSSAELKTTDNVA
jgi:sec-independent protein translocase protein TatB